MKKILTLMLAASLLPLAIAAQDATYDYKVGGYTVTLLSEGQQQGRTSILIGAGNDILKQYAPEGTFPNAMNAFLVRTPDNRNILIDTGVGRKLIENLASLNITPGDIDAILLTHTHGDHVGGMMRDGKAVFPNAKVYISEKEYDFWESQKNSAATIEAYKDRLVKFNPESSEYGVMVIPGFLAVAAYGHTPGHTVYAVMRENRVEMVVWGDLTHAIAVQMPHPEISVTYDSDPKQAAAFRTQAFEILARYGIPAAGMHIAWPGMGYIANAGDGYKFNPMETQK